MGKREKRVGTETDRQRERQTSRDRKTDRDPHTEDQ